MKFLSLLTLPLLSLTFANPLPQPASAELALRQASSDLAARTFFEHDWRCSNDKVKSDCKKKGGQWACDKTCQCIEKPVECGSYCPLRDLKKKLCEIKPGYDFNDDNCSCDKVKPVCKVDDVTNDCKKKGLSFDKDNCCCGAPLPPVCKVDDVTNDCKKKGLSFDKDNCCCGAPLPPVCKVNDVTEDCKKKGLSFDKDHCCCGAPLPPTCKVNDVTEDCKKKGLSFDKDNCCCGAPLPPVCKVSDVTEDCKKKGLSFDKDKCCCGAPIPQPPKCNDWDKKSCKGTWNDDSCKCEAKPDDKECGDWYSVWLCKLKGKSCNSSCACY